MKKLLTVLFTLLVIFTLVGCNDKKEEPVVDEPIVGGYTEAEDKNLTPELIEMFEKALDGLMGANYTPVMLEATQVVAGTNYKFKADGTKTTNPMIMGTYYVYIYKDLQGNVSLLDIEVIEEHEVQKFEPEVKLDTEIKQDVTQMDFWVVFYDQYGNELQREALRYGTVPEYKSWLPEGFEKWVYKNTQKDVETLKAITRNTYYQAVCHPVKHKDKNNHSVDSDQETGINYLYIKNIGSTPTIIGMKSFIAPEDTLEFEYSKDKTNWVDVIINEPISMAVNEKIYFKAKTSNPYMIKRVTEVGDKGVIFASEGTGTNAFEVGGSIMTLLDPTDTLRDLSGKNTCFAGLFRGMNEELKNADNLVAPATKLAPYCYDGMFYGTGLVSVNPDLLPATDLSVTNEGGEGNGCYCGMFFGCDSLVNSPILPAEILQKNCYSNMFYGCSSLNSITMLATDVSAEDCLDDWTNGVAETGTFVKNPSLAIGTEEGQIPLNSNSGIPDGWTDQNTEKSLSYVVDLSFMFDELYIYNYDDSKGEYVFVDDCYTSTYNSNLGDFPKNSWIHKYDNSTYGLCSKNGHEVSLPQIYTLTANKDCDESQSTMSVVEGMYYSCDAQAENKYLNFYMNNQFRTQFDTRCSGYTLKSMSVNGDPQQLTSISGTVTGDFTITFYYEVDN